MLFLMYSAPHSWDILLDITPVAEADGFNKGTSFSMPTVVAPIVSL